jgi:hypothetical protein
MKPSHEKALRAALRVTMFGVLGTGALACGSGTPKVASSSAPLEASAAKVELTSEGDCKQALAAAFPDGDKEFYEREHKAKRAPTAATDTQLTACCEAHGGTFATEDYRQLGCCSLKYDGMHCTPWGPPMPVALVA